jgi:hypothetical protein
VKYDSGTEGEVMLTPRDKVEQGLRLIEDAIVEFLNQRGDWVLHSVIQDELNLRSDFNGKFAGYLSGTILQRLTEQKRIVKEGGGRGNETRFRLSNSN